VLAGRIAAAKGDKKQAIAEYKTAVEKEDALDYDEPADWFYPTRETLGAALLRNKQPAEAAKVFRADLKRNPHNPRSLYGLAAHCAPRRRTRRPQTQSSGGFGWEEACV